LIFYSKKTNNFSVQFNLRRLFTFGYVINKILKSCFHLYNFVKNNGEKSAEYEKQACAYSVIKVLKMMNRSQNKLIA